MNQEQKMQMNVDIKQTVPVESEDGNQVFQEATVLRKISKFLTQRNDNKGRLLIKLNFHVNNECKL